MSREVPAGGPPRAAPGRWGRVGEQRHKDMTLTLTRERRDSGRNGWPAPARDRAHTALPFLAIGTGCVIAGGFVAAVTAHAPTEHTSWAAAYLVLVAGAAQVALGAGQALLARHRPSARLVVGELLAWNLGNAAVIAGTVAGVTAAVDVGGAALVVALMLMLAATTGRRRTGWPLWVFRGVVVVVLVSIPVGLVLAELRPG